jgi:hypothetical protein
MTASDHATTDEFDTLDRICADSGPEAMFDALATSLSARRRWHALFDLRILQARLAVGLPPAGGPADIPADLRDRFDERSLAACREVGWPLLEEGHVSAAWMYLRAAAEPAEMSRRLEALAARVSAEEGGDDEEAARTFEEIVGVTLWEGVDPALGIGLVIRTQGTCNAITAYEQAVSRLPAARQRPAAGVLVSHLHAEVSAGLAQEFERRGLDAPPEISIATCLERLADDPGLHVDVSHHQSVLRIARVCDDEPTIRRAWELASYASRLPPDVVYPGEPPFENVGAASRLFYGSQIGVEVADALRYFRTEAVGAEPMSGTLPCDTLVLLLTRLGRPAEALHAALARPRNETAMPSPLQAAGAIPSVIDLAAASGEWELLRRACRERGDEITFAAALVAERHQKRSDVQRGPQV